MTLRTRLALSHLFAIVLFALIFISIFISINGGAGPPRHSLGPKNSIMSAADAASSVAALRATVDSLRLDPELEVALWHHDGHREVLSPFSHAGRTESFSETLPLLKGELRGCTLEVKTFRPKPPPNSWWNPLRDLVLAAGVAGLACVGLSIAISRFVSKPVAKLAEAVEKFEGKPLPERLVTDGPPEIKELAETFNEMADRLSTNMEELRLQKEEAERSEQSRRQFLGEVSHNLRTPLSAILGWTEQLIDGLAKGDETAYLKRIRRETRYVSTTIERLLDLSRWERARPMLHIEPFALTEALLETAENLEEAAVEKGIELNLDLPEAPCWVEADRHRVRDLFQILLENVVQHAGTNVKVEVSVRLTDDRYWVTVSDDGVGLPDRLKTGWRGDPLVAATGRASLGLAIARHLAEAHHGELRLSGGPNGVGTMATFSLPFAPVSEKLNRRGVIPSGSGSPLPAP